MRRAVLLVLFLALAPSTTTSKTPSDNLIVPGQRIGPWTLEMNVDQFARTVGRTKISKPKMEIDLAVPVNGYCGVEICAYYRVKEKIISLRVSHISGFSNTGKGVGVGSPLSKVLAAYGRPTAKTRFGDDYAGYARVIYDDIGLTLRANSVTETVISIGVFRPGTARSIWQFQAN